MSFYRQQIAPMSDEQIRHVCPSVFASHADSRVSDRYTFLPTIEVVNGLRGQGWFPVQAKEMNVRLKGRSGFQKHLIRFQRPEDIEAQRNSEALQYAPGQHKIVKGEITPELVLVNSHDRTSAYQLHAGLFRLVCSNGLIICDETFAKIRVRHTGNDVRDVIEGSFQIIKEVPALMDNVQTMKAKELSAPVREAFAEAGLILKYGDLAEAPVQAATALIPRRSQDAGTDLWSTFNVLQENLTQGGLRYRTQEPGKPSRRGSTRAVTSIDENVKLNKALWHIAEKLKAA